MYKRRGIGERRKNKDGNERHRVILFRSGRSGNCEYFYDLLEGLGHKVTGTSVEDEDDSGGEDKEGQNRRTKTLAELLRMVLVICNFSTLY